jgi:sirohydrochlorin cobaltochelatase
VLVERIYSITDEIAGSRPEIEFLKAQYLSDQVSVIDTFEERVRGILSGENNMNCQLCKYREQIIGFEAHHGLPQEGHHHHVEGIGTGGDAQTEEGHGHSHHPAHPHPEHPHGPGRRNPSAVD